MCHIWQRTEIHSVLVREPDGMRPLERFKHRWMENYDEIV
jgi:hypothetical protein